MADYKWRKWMGGYLVVIDYLGLASWVREKREMRTRAQAMHSEWLLEPSHMNYEALRACYLKAARFFAYG